MRGPRARCCRKVAILVVQSNGASRVHGESCDRSVSTFPYCIRWYKYRPLMYGGGALQYIKFCGYGFLAVETQKLILGDKVSIDFA
jgi:hypothetical protein